jgi:NAD(P)-dependent dehydrogenase (short-subunit alcohol dehydrogenase family)
MKHQLSPTGSQSDGAIVSVAALTVLRWSDGACPSYAVAKAGVIGLTEHAAVNYVSDSLWANVVAVGQPDWQLARNDVMRWRRRHGRSGG